MCEGDKLFAALPPCSRGRLLVIFDPHQLISINSPTNQHQQFAAHLGTDGPSYFNPQTENCRNELAEEKTKPKPTSFPSLRCWRGEVLQNSSSSVKTHFFLSVA